MNCENVFEIAKFDRELENIHESLEELERATESLKERKTERKFVMLNDQEKIIQKAIDALEEVKKKFKNEIDKQVQIAVSEINTDIASVKVIEESVLKNIGIIKTAVKYGDSKCNKVIGHKILDNIMEQKNLIKDIDNQEEYKLLFMKNEDEIQVSSLGTLSLIREERNETNETDEGIETTSDEVRENATVKCSQAGNAAINASQSDNTVRDISQLKNKRVNTSSVLNTSTNNPHVGKSNEAENISHIENIAVNCSKGNDAIVDILKAENTSFNSLQSENGAVISSQSQNVVLNSLLADIDMTVDRSEADTAVVDSSQTETTRVNNAQAENPTVNVKAEDIAINRSQAKSAFVDISQLENTNVSSSQSENISQTENVSLNSSQTDLTAVDSLDAKEPVGNSSQKETTDVIRPKVDFQAVKPLKAENADKTESYRLPTISESFVTEKRTFSIRGFSDKKICSIYGISVLENGGLIIIDRDNSNIKLLSSDYSLCYDLKLPGKPIRLCSIGDNRFAVSFDRLKRINRYSVEGNTICYDGGFQTTLFCHGIGFDGKNIAAIMCDQDFYYGNNAKYNTIQIEFRDPFNGHVKDVITDFKFERNNTWSLILNNTMAIGYAENCTMVIAELNRVTCFSRKKECNKTVAVQENFFVCWGPPLKDAIENIAMDSESLFVCTATGCVLQISSSDFRISRMIVTDTDKAFYAIAVDSRNGRIILGCLKNDEILCYELKTKV
jgi:hypothetical protein